MLETGLRNATGILCTFKGTSERFQAMAASRTETNASLYCFLCVCTYVCVHERSSFSLGTLDLNDSDDRSRMQPGMKSADSVPGMGTKRLT